MRLINADAVLEHFAEYWAMQKKLKRPSKQQHAQYMTMRSIVNSLKTEDAVPVQHGMFIGTEYDGYADGNPVYYEWKCSECGCIFEEEEPTYRYCPNCGARMDEE